MNSDKTAIEIRNLDKVYRLCHANGKEENNSGKDFYALRNLTLDIRKGEFVGIMGSNGSGKSTLLKILSGILKPTHGIVKIYGSVSSVLDIGVNLHPELSGKENALLQLKINGVKKRDTENILGQIRALSDIGEYFFEPVKYYSNGMFLRLGFALSFHVNSDILLLDEVLSVGDEEFRLKCHAHLKKLAAENKTILLVTHNPIEALSLCNTCIWLKNGHIEKSGTAPAVIGSYIEWQRQKFMLSAEEASEKKSAQQGTENQKNKTDGFCRAWTAGDAPGNKILTLRSIVISQGSRFDQLFTDEEFSIEVLFTKHSSEISLSLLLVVSDQFGQPVFLSHNLNNADRENHEGIFKGDTGLFRMQCTVPSNFLAAGRYKLVLQFGMNPTAEIPHTEEAFRYDDEVYFHLRYKPGKTDFIRERMNGAVRPAFKWVYAKAQA